MVAEVARDGVSMKMGHVYFIPVVQHPEEAQFPYAPQKAVELGIADEILKADLIAAHLAAYRPS